MGFFSNLIGSTDSSVISNGILGRGEITDISISSVTLRTGNNLVERKCTFSMNVMIDNVAPFQASAVQRIPEVVLAKLTKGAVVPVRVDPSDHSKVFIDFKSELPTVTLPRSTGENSAAYILEHGKPIKVVFVGSQPMKLKNADGIEMFLLTLTVYEGVDTPYQVQVGNPVPATALPLLYPGSKLHAKLGAGPNNVVVDWAAGPAS
ncbi:MAG TPA: hypothetical protein PLM53_19840 [Spirochaetota bacterium]|nr:hypothetical protein [Spirochaetota bacterium]HQF10201.1 hypothetical protein [Spirochaetota bacterium]HQH99347.1 hypothetical protein [Spirochaetota bacterium]